MSQNFPAAAKKGKSGSKTILISGGIGLAVVAFVGFLVFATGGWLCGYMEPGNFDVPGDAHKFDPVAQYDAVAEKAGKGCKFLGLKARYVRANGTLNLHASYKPEVKYAFIRDNPKKEKSAEPKGVGSKKRAPYQTVTMTLSEPGRTSHVTRKGAGCRSGEYTVRYFGMLRTTSTASSSPDRFPPKPKCSFAKLWNIAQKNGADPSAVAIISYGIDGYDFSIKDTDVKLHFNHNCEKASRKGGREKVSGTSD
jgi:hypothetical protein